MFRKFVAGLALIALMIGVSPMANAAQSSQRIDLDSQGWKRGWACITHNDSTSRMAQLIRQWVSIPGATHRLVSDADGRNMAVKNGAKLKRGDLVLGVCKYAPKNPHQYAYGVEVSNRLELALYGGSIEFEYMGGVKCGKTWQGKRANVWVATDDEGETAYLSRAKALKHSKNVVGCYLR